MSRAEVDHAGYATVGSDNRMGCQLASDGATRLGAYNTIDGSISYDPGNFKLKPPGFKLADTLSRIDFDGTYAAHQLRYQVKITIQIEFRQFKEAKSAR